MGQKGRLGAAFLSYGVLIDAMTAQYARMPIA